MTTLDFDVIGEDIAARHLFDMGQRAADSRPAFRKIRDLLIRGNAKTFATKGGYIGETWPPLAPSTVERKGNAEIGVRTGALKASLMGGRGRQTSVTKKQVKVGTKVWYARMFAGGTKTGQPPRPIVGFTEGQQNVANFLLRRYITQGHA